MSLLSSYNGFVSKVKSSFLDSRNNSENSSANSNSVILKLSNDLSIAISDFIDSAVIITNDVVNTGQVDLPGNGITNSPGNGSGIGSFVNSKMFISSLSSQINKAFLSLKNEAIRQNNSSNSLISQLSTDLSMCIKSFIESLSIQTNVIINPGQTAIGSFGVGIYSSPGTGKGTGKVTFSDYTKLKSEIYNSFINSRSSGEKSGIDSNQVISSLASDICKSIYEFCQTGSVKCDVFVNPGIIVTGYVTPAGVPLVSTSSSGTGKSTGKMT